MVTSSRDQLTQKILAQKLRLNLRWADIANLLGRSKEWTTAACLGQMQMNKPQAEAIRDVFLLNDEECAWLQSAPYKSSNSIPSDPCLYRFYEVSVNEFDLFFILLSQNSINPCIMYMIYVISFNRPSAFMDLHWRNWFTRNSVMALWALLILPFMSIESNTMLATVYELFGRVNFYLIANFEQTKELMHKK